MTRRYVNHRHTYVCDGCGSTIDAHGLPDDWWEIEFRQSTPGKGATCHYCRERCARPAITEALASIFMTMAKCAGGIDD